MGSKTITGRSLLFLLASALILIVASRLARSVSAEATPVLVGALASPLTFLLTLLFVRWDVVRLSDVGVGITKRTAPRLLLGFFVGVAIVALQDLVIYCGGHTHWEIDRSHFSFGPIAVALAGYFLLALREELSFRGYPLRRMESAWGTWSAIIVIGFLFTLEHAAGGWGLRALLGPPFGAMLFGIAALATRGLAVPLGIHAAFNFGQWFMGQKENAGALRLVIDTGFDKQAETLGYAAYCLDGHRSFWVLVLAQPCGWLAQTVVAH